MLILRHDTPLMDVAAADAGAAAAMMLAAPYAKDTLVAATIARGAARC